jgi:hypothetical protein
MRRGAESRRRYALERFKCMYNFCTRRCTRAHPASGIRPLRVCVCPVCFLCFSPPGACTCCGARARTTPPLLRCLSAGTHAKHGATALSCILH